MPAPQLLAKRALQADLATQRKQEIDKGTKLVKAIEDLRGAKDKESKELEEFRRETIVRVQLEIDTKIAEKESLSREVARLKEERILALSPVDLRQEWQKVREDRMEVDSWKERLTASEIEILARENKLADALKEARAVLEESSQKKELADRTLQEADEKFEKASGTLESAKSEANEILGNAREIEKSVIGRKSEVDERDRSITYREAASRAHDEELSAREKNLTEHQSTYSTDMALRESNLLEALKGLVTREKSIEVQEESAAQKVLDTMQKEKEASLLLKNAQSDHDKLLAKVIKKEQEVQGREELTHALARAITARETELNDLQETLTRREESNKQLLETQSIKEQELSSKEIELEGLSRTLSRQAKDIERKNTTAERNLSESERKLAESTLVLTQTETESNRVLAEAKQREAHLAVREEEATLREVRLSARETALEEHSKDLSNREKKLRSRQELFLRSQQYIKNKK